MSIDAPPPVNRQTEQLVKEHRQLRDEPLLLAISYQPQRDPGDLFLFEIIDGFGAGRIEEDRKFFEVTFSSSPSFPMKPRQRLHLILTNPEEFQVADREDWPSLEEIREAVRAKRAITVFADPARPDLEARIHG
ncbi:MAG TPA: hypothetical protein VFC78_08910 [Tepidisphaeraceae bacterium]|nr:hypothetical protein [Tepidisphaeraceae bacterium]